MLPLMGVRRVAVLLSVSLSLLGQFSCGAAQEIVPLIEEPGSKNAAVSDARPLKLVIVVGNSKTLILTDPRGTRASATISLLDRQASETSALLMSFAGQSLSYMPSGAPHFTTLADATTSERRNWVEQLLSFSGSVDIGDIDYVTPLQAVHTAIAADIKSAATPSRYEVVFVSDSGPSTQDAALLCSPLISNLIGLSDGRNEVRLNTIMINQAEIPSCGDQLTVSECSIAPVDSLCATSLLAATYERLSRIARLGNGTFRAFGHGDVVDFGLVLK